MLEFDLEKFSDVISRQSCKIKDIGLKAGIQDKFLYKIKSGERSATEKEIEQLADALSCRIEDITALPKSLYAYPSMSWGNVAHCHYPGKYKKSHYYSHSSFRLPCDYQYCQPVIRDEMAFDPKADLLIDPEVLPVSGDIVIVIYKAKLMVRHYISGENGVYLGIENAKYLAQTQLPKCELVVSELVIIGVVEQVLQSNSVKEYLF